MPTATNKLEILMSLTGMAQVITGINQLIEVTGRIASFAAKPVEIVQNLINAADEAGRAAQKLGFASVEAFSKFQHAANMADVSNESFTAGVKNLDKALAAAAANPMSETAQAFAAIGFSATDAAGKLKTPEAAILELSDKFSGFTDDANKSALALKIFGRAGIDMIPLLNQGAAAIRDAGAEIDGVNKDEAEQAKQFRGNLKLLHAVMIDMANTVVKSLLPYLAEFSAWLVKLQKDSGFFAAVAGTIIDVLKWLAVAAYDVYITFKVLGTIIGSVSAAVSLEFDSSIRASVQLVGIWFAALKGIGSQLLNVANTAGTAAQAMMKFATGDYLGALNLAKKGATDFGAEVASIGKTISGAVVDSGNVFVDKYAKDFADAKSIAKGAAKDIADDLLKLGTFTLDIFSPKAPGAHEAPLRKPTTATPGTIDASVLKAIETAKVLLAELRAEELTGSAQIFAVEEARHEKRLKQIEDLKKQGADTRALEEQAERDHQAKLSEIYKQALDVRAELDAAAKEGDLRRTIDTLESESGARLANLQANQSMVQTFTAIWEKSFVTLGATVHNFASSVLNTFSQAASSALTNIITGTMKASDAFKELGKAMLNAVVTFFTQLIVNTILAKAVQAAAGAAMTAVALGEAGALAGAWGTAAALANMATFGGASAFGPLVVPIAAASGALSKGLAIGFGGVAHGGLDFVPGETTFLVNRGERIVQPEANKDLTEFLADKSGGQPIVVELVLNEYKVGRAFFEMSRNGRLSISQQAIV